MERFVTTDAQRDTFDFHRVLKLIYDGLVQRDFNAMKFLCTEFIPLQKMEKVKTALDLFNELKSRRKIFPPDNVSLVAELLYCLQQHRLCKMLPYSCHDVEQSVEGGRSQLHPCRILLHRICEDITEENFKALRYLCTPISKSAMEKICSPHDLILALEKQGLIGVAKGDLSYLRRILYDTHLEELVARIDQLFISGMFTGSSINQNVGSPEACQSSTANNVIVNLRVSPPPNIPLQECIHGARGHQNTEAPGNQFPGAVPKVFSTKRNYPDVLEGQPRIEAGVMETQPFQGSSMAVDTDQDENYLPSYSMTRRPRELLEKVFGQKLDFKVEVWNDLTDTEILDELAATASKDHSNFDCFVCCILSHGVNGAIYGANGKLVEIKRITSFFRPSSCRSLCGKPKLFFIQACQGKDRQRVSDIVTDGPTIPEGGGGAFGGVGVVLKAETLPDEADFLVALSTVPGYVSYRSKSKGSWYIPTLVRMLETYADRWDLLSILTCVNDEISRTEDLMKGIVCKQVSMPMTTLRKQVQFYVKK